MSVMRLPWAVGQVERVAAGPLVHPRHGHPAEQVVGCLEGRPRRRRATRGARHARPRGGSPDAGGRWLPQVLLRRCGTPLRPIQASARPPGWQSPDQAASGRPAVLHVVHGRLCREHPPAEDPAPLDLSLPGRPHLHGSAPDHLRDDPADDGVRDLRRGHRPAEGGPDHRDRRPVDRPALRARHGPRVLRRPRPADPAPAGDSPRARPTAPAAARTLQYLYVAIPPMLLIMVLAIFGWHANDIIGLVQLLGLISLGWWGYFAGRKAGLSRAAAVVVRRRTTASWASLVIVGRADHHALTCQAATPSAPGRDSRPGRHAAQERRTEGARLLQVDRPRCAPSWRAFASATIGLRVQPPASTAEVCGPATVGHLVECHPAMAVRSSTTAAPRQRRA